MPILLFSPGDESHVAFIQAKIRSRGGESVAFNVRDPSSTGIHLRLEDGRVSGYLRVEDRKYSLDDFYSFLGPFTELTINWPHADEDVRLFAREEWLSALFATYQLTRDRYWINPLESYLLGESKPYQRATAAQSGLRTPVSVISTEEGEVREFIGSAHTGVALKRVSHPPRTGGPYSKWMLYSGVSQILSLS